MTNGNLTEFFIHKVGNKGAGEPLFLSDKNILLTDDLVNALSSYFFSSFKEEEYYRLHHDFDLNLNEVYNCVSAVFDNPDTLYEQSRNLATHLYNHSVHPKVKGGELYVAHFTGCTLNGDATEAIGLFKSENKDTFLQVEQVMDGFEMDCREGININKLDKGCLIFNQDKENGYILSVIDNTNKGSEAQYWKDNFLNIFILNNDYHQTHQFLGITKQFVTEKLEEDFEVSKADKIDLLNRSVDYFKTHEVFNKEEFEVEVFGDQGVIESFRTFDQNYRQENEVELSDEFDISSQAVKKQARVFKSVIKLDKNFHIYIHGNREMIEQGVDEKGRKYYKMYYENEA